MTNRNPDHGHAAAYNHAWMQMAFMAIQQGREEFALVPCSVNGHPSGAICMGHTLDNGRVEVMPLFVAYTGGIEIEFRQPERDGGGGGPKQPPRSAAVERQFKVTVSAMTQQHR